MATVFHHARGHEGFRRFNVDENMQQNIKGKGTKEIYYHALLYNSVIT